MLNLKFHHIGVATKHIDREFSIYQKMGYRKLEEPFCDEIQKIKGMFIVADNQPCLELLENLSEEGPLTSVLSKGIKYYHTAYEVQNIEDALSEVLNELGAMVICPITQATYFKKICFLMLKNRAIIELVEPLN